MDSLCNSSLFNPTNDNSLLAFQAERLLTQIDWTYYTIWRKATTPNLQGLAWNRGNENQAHGNMGLLLQEFYKHCSFLPLGCGMQAVEAFESGRYRWASGEELLLQIRFLSIQNQLTLPPELQAPYFKTVVYIPLEKGAGVLEIGTINLVPESESGIIFQILGSMIDGLATQGTSKGDQIMSSSFEDGTKALPNNAGNHYGDPYEQYRSASMMEIYGSRPILQHPSITSPYWSSTSTTSSSTPSASDPMGNTSNATFALNTSPAQVSSMNNEDMLMGPASSLHGTPKSMVDELHILDQLDQIDMYDVSTPISLPYFDSSGLNNADLIHFSHDHQLPLSAIPLNFCSTNVSPSPPLLTLPDNSPYLDPHSESNAHNNLLDCVLQPMQCASSARNNAQVDAHHSLNEIVGGPSKEPNMACQTEVTTLPLVTCRASSHSVFYSNDQQQQSRSLFPSTSEGERMNDLFGQSERNVHAIISAEISKIPLGEDSLGDDRLEANVIMQEQGGVLMIEDEGSTSRKRKLIMGMSSTNSKGYEAFVGGKMSNEQGEKMVVSSTVTSTTQATGRYVSYASGSAEADKIGGSSESKVAGSFVSSAYGSAEAYKVVGSSRSLEATGSYVSLYASGSAEAEKVVGSSTVFSSSCYGAGRLNTASGKQQDDQYIASSFGTPHEMSPAQVHHMHAERKRRRKQSDCINTLRALLPNITKKDKITILESTIQYLKELKRREYDLEQENSALMNLSFKDQRKSSKDSTQSISSQENAMCDYDEDHFRLNLIKKVQDVNVNATMIEIMNALIKKNLNCYKIKSKFWKDTSQLSIKILANYKNGENHSPTLEEIQRIEQWWKQRCA